LTSLECPYENFHWDHICRGDGPLTAVEESVQKSAPFPEILRIKIWVKIWGQIKKIQEHRFFPNFVSGRPLWGSFSVQELFPHSPPDQRYGGKTFSDFVTESRIRRHLPVIYRTMLTILHVWLVRVTIKLRWNFRSPSPYQNGVAAPRTSLPVTFLPCLDVFRQIWPLTLALSPGSTH